MIVVRVSPEAEFDSEEAALDYDAQHVGLGLEFLLELDETLQRITEHPEGYQVLYRRVRRAPLRRFPYGVFYRLEGDQAFVLAVLHLSRDPEAWKGRTRRR